MGLFDFMKSDEINDIDEGIKRFKKIPWAVLIDVRNTEEYKKGHIPDSINIPEKDIQKAESVIKDRNTDIFLYCLSGAKSWNAEKKLKELGFKNARSIGGINQYSGPIEQS